jgi:2OG-Fe(II) oxygenase superfamily
MAEGRVSPELLRLRGDPSELRAGYESADPYPHAVIDGLFPDRWLEAVLDEFPALDDPDWMRFDNAEEKKLGNYRRLFDVGPHTEKFLFAVSGPAMLGFLEALTGIDGLIPDPYFGGGALHQIPSGGFLKVHADFNWHPKLRLDRRLNMLVYLNPGWEDGWGGALELWSRDRRGPVRTIMPYFNRTVVFSTTDVSFHGHPHPLTCPAGVSRKSVSLYYYSNGRPDAEKSSPHDTIFLPDDP